MLRFNCKPSIDFVYDHRTVYRGRKRGHKRGLSTGVAHFKLASTSVVATLKRRCSRVVALYRGTEHVQRSRTEDVRTWSSCHTVGLMC